MQQIENIPRLKPRAADAHKGDFGKVAIIAGSIGMSGAAALAGRSALRAGAGLVRVAVPKSVLPIVASIEPSFTTVPLAEDGTGRISAKATNAILDIAGENDVLAFALNPALERKSAKSAQNCQKNTNFDQKIARNYKKRTLFTKKYKKIPIFHHFFAANQP